MNEHAALAAALDRNELVALTCDLIRRQSHPGVETHEEAAARYLAELLNRHGIEAELQLIREHRYNVLARIPGRNRDKTLLLTGHTDTVGDYGCEGLFEPKVKDGRIHGRGACDMKGPVAAMVEAALMLARAGATPACDVALAFVADEEFQSIGTEKLIASGFAADAAVLGEPTGMKMCLGNRGLEWADIRVKGRGGHGSATAGTVNAVVNAAKLVCRIETEIKPRFADRTHPVLGHPQLNVGLIRGGDQPSTVPETCLIKLDRRWIDGESVDGVYAELQGEIDALHAEDPRFEATLSRNLSNLYTMEHGPVCIPADHPVVAALSAALTALTGEAPEKAAFPGWTDASLLGNFGRIPTVIAGPGDIACAHSARECVAIDELCLAARAYARLCLTYGER
jgi:acetylornithine deacetylase/succinyl-diaminopimelate desuccinylase family protein